MRGHLFIAFGALIGAIFLARLFDAKQTTPSIWQWLYIAGGFILSGLLIFRGIKARRD